MKKILLGLTLAFSLAFTSHVLADEEIKLNIDNKAIESDVAPQIIDGRTMVPVRAIFEGVGATVDWNADTKTITGSMNGINVVMTLDSSIATVNGKEITMDCAPVISEGRTLAPARYVAEAFGCSVNWDNENKTVNITTPLFKAETTTAETTAETTTETTTAATTETTTNPMYNYSTYYAPGTYAVGTDMPAGEYVVFANPDKIGYLYKYAKDGNVSTTTGKRHLYSKNFDYCDVIKLDTGNYLDLSNAYAIPSADVEKLDATHNGTFRAGKDIKSGHLTFKLNPSSTVGYVNIGTPDAANKDRTIVYLTPDDDSVTVNVTAGMYIKIFACDVLDEKLSAIYTYAPVSIETSSTDNTYNFEDITPSVKNTIDEYLTTLVNEMEPKAMKGTKYTANYANKITDSWTSMAKTSADRKYASLAKELYTHIRTYAYNTKGDVAYSAVISMNSQQISGADYRDILKYEKEYITRTVSSFKSGTSYADLEEAVKHMAYYRYDVPRLTGTNVS